MSSQERTIAVPPVRIRQLNGAVPNADGRFVFYWMNAFRRAEWNFSLDRAVHWCLKLNRPLVVVETLSCGQRWDSDRHHRFVIDGMAENARRLDRPGVAYYALIETAQGLAEQAVVALARTACVVVTDDFPLREHRVRIAAVAGRLGVLVEAVDSNGVLPLRAADRIFPTAFSFRRFLQRTLRDHLLEFPQADPFKTVRLPSCAPNQANEFDVPGAFTPTTLRAEQPTLAAIPLDHAVMPVGTKGGIKAAKGAWRRFLAGKVKEYAARRNHPDDDATSGLSPYLHFGHISAHEVFAELSAAENWNPGQLSPRASGSAEGWWGMSPSAEAFLDELITWRELGYNMCAFSDDYDSFDSLPDWAKQTLEKHTADARDYVYTLEQFEKARTHDPLWNAAQRQLVREGRLHNYLRMLWGKKILQWTSTPREALAVMIHLNNKYALDGRDPNSYSGIFWVLGRYDRAWGPERPVFGTVRYMCSRNTARKVRVKEYLRKFGDK